MSAGGRAEGRRAKDDHDAGHALGAVVGFHMTSSQRASPLRALTGARRMPTVAEAPCDFTLDDGPALDETARHHEAPPCR